MVLKLNGVTLGILRPDREDTFGWRGDEPESSGTTVIPAYAVGRLHDKISVSFNISDYKAVTTAIRKLFEDDPSGVYYLHETDTDGAVYGDQAGVWITNITVKAKCTHLTLGEGTLEGTVTADHQDALYLPE